MRYLNFWCKCYFQFGKRCQLLIASLAYQEVEYQKRWPNQWQKNNVNSSAGNDFITYNMSQTSHHFSFIFIHLFITKSFK